MPTQVKTQTLTADLTALTDVAGPVKAIGYTGMSVQAVADSTGWGSTTAAVSLEYSLDNTTFLTPATALSLTDVATHKANYDITGMAYLHFTVTTAQSDAGTVTLTVHIW